MGTCGAQEKPNVKIQQNNMNQLSQEERAIYDCKKCRDNLKNYIKKLERSEKSQKDKAKEFLKEKNRPRAKMCLNRSKIFAAQIESANNNLTVIEEQILRIEQTKSQAEVFKVLETGNNVLKELQKEVNIEKWEAIRDDMDDLKAQQQEIGDFLKSHNIDETESESELKRDLEKLMEQEGIKLDSEIPNPPEKNTLKDEIPDASDKNLERNIAVEKVETEHNVQPNVKSEKEKVLVEDI